MADGFTTELTLFAVIIGPGVTPLAVTALGGKQISLSAVQGRQRTIAKSRRAKRQR
jgi:hypothetical protein